MAHKVEGDAKKYAKGNAAKEKAYLDSISTQPVYPLLKYNYLECKSKELALGLDLQGGMSVTMQVSLRELVATLSGNNPDVVLKQALDKADIDSRTSQSDYVTLFVNEYEKLNPNGRLASIFSTRDNQEHLKFNATNAEVETYLKEQADVAVQQTYTVLNTRIDQYGVTQPNIQLLKDRNQVLIELPGVTEPERVRKLLQGTAKLEFYKTYDNTEALPVLEKISTVITANAKVARDTIKKANKDTTTAKKTAADNSLLSKLQSAQKSPDAAKDNQAGSESLFGKNALIPNIYNGQNGPQPVPGPTVGFAAVNDTARINKFLALPALKSVIPTNLKFLWAVKPIDKDESQFKDNIKRLELFAVKLAGPQNGPVLAGDVITDARSEIDQTTGKWEVSMSMSSQGAQKWEEITAEAAPQSAGTRGIAIAIVLDNNVYSAPGVMNKISGGVSSISGNFTQEDTKDLANVLKAGRLRVPALIVSEDTVGPTLGQQAIQAGFLSSLLGFVVVLIFMIAYYNRAGTIAVAAVIVNVFFLMGVLISIGSVLTMPGVAGIVLTLGISVDANVLIYERVREELALGKSIKLAVADGFRHALP
ncbi:MAG: protein translocase subunit SecD, partial [Mucilaginibacter sp.]